TPFSIITNLLHFGCTVVGLDYGFKGQNGVDVVRGGAPYGATTVADRDGSRQPRGGGRGGARYPARRVAGPAAEVTGRAGPAGQRVPPRAGRGGGISHGAQPPRTAGGQRWRAGLLAGARCSPARRRWWPAARALRAPRRARPIASSAARALGSPAAAG